MVDPEYQSSILFAISFKYQSRNAKAIKPITDTITKITAINQSSRWKIKFRIMPNIISMIMPMKKMGLLPDLENELRPWNPPPE